jgi:hypothetical protein
MYLLQNRVVANEKCVAGGCVRTQVGDLSSLFALFISLGDRGDKNLEGSCVGSWLKMSTRR